MHVWYVTSWNTFTIPLTISVWCWVEFSELSILLLELLSGGMWLWWGCHNAVKLKLSHISITSLTFPPKKCSSLAFAVLSSFTHPIKVKPRGTFTNSLTSSTAQHFSFKLILLIILVLLSLYKNIFDVLWKLYNSVSKDITTLQNVQHFLTSKITRSPNL